VETRSLKNLRDRIELMEQQLRALKVRHLEAEAKRKREAAAQAKLDEARRIMLVGQIVLERVSRGELSESQLRGWLDAGLDEQADRQLFGIEPGSSATSA
jgi:hypothetical protein